MKINKPIIMAVTLFGILLLIYFLVYPEYQKFKTLQSELGIKKAEYVAKFEYYAETTRVYNELKKNKENLEKVDSALPSDPNLGKLFYFFNNQTLKNGLVLKSIFLTRSSSSSKNTVKEINFSMSVFGSYSALESFISSLEKSVRMVEVINIAFSSGGQDSGTDNTQFQSGDNFSFNVQVKTYTY